VWYEEVVKSAAKRKKRPPTTRSEEAPSSEPAASLRRVPLQARSKERYERILDAAEEAFASVGYDAATTEGIAEQAGTSIGSLYQFFPNKRALFDALTARFLDEVRAFFDRFLEASRGAVSWEPLVDMAVDGFWAFQRGSRGFQAVWVHGNLSLDLIQASDDVGREIAARVADLLEPFAPGLDRKRRELIATMAIESVSGMLFVAERRRDLGADAVIFETKTLVKRYLAAYLGEPQPPTSSRS